MKVPEQSKVVNKALDEFVQVLRKEGVCLAGILLFPGSRFMASVTFYPVEMSVIPPEFAAVSMIVENKVEFRDLATLLLKTMISWEGGERPDPVRGVDMSDELSQPDDLSPDMRAQLEELFNLLNSPPNFKEEKEDE